MNTSATFRWIGLALLGLLVAVAVAIAASNLVSRQIGLSSESISAGNVLAPAANPDRENRSPSSGHGHDRGDDETTPTITSPPPEQPPATTTVEPPAAAGDEHSEGHSGDD